MAVAIVEKIDNSPGSTIGNAPTAELVYTVTGALSAVDARAALLAESPATYAMYGDLSLVLKRNEIRVAPISGTSDAWEGRVSYVKKLPPPQATTEGYTVQFDTAGGTQRITQAIQTVVSYKSGGGDAPDVKDAIGVSDSGVDGVDITVPVFQFTETHIVADADMDSSYIATLHEMTGRVNQSAFRMFAAYEVLFLGVSGQKRGEDEWELQFKFAASKNKTDITIGDITGIAKRGWEYLWVRYKEKKDTTNHVMLKIPAAVYVDQVYYVDDFDRLAIGG